MNTPYKAEVTHYKKEGLSKVTLSWVMSYDDWKQTYAENLERYDKEKKMIK